MAQGLEAALGERLLEGKRVEGWVNVPDDCVCASGRIHLHGARPPGVNEPTTEQGGLQMPSDLTQDAQLNLSDAIALLGHLFLGNPTLLPCGDSTVSDPANLLLLDANGDGGVNLSDGIHVLTYLFLGGPPPAEGTECLRIGSCPDLCIP